MLKILPEFATMHQTGGVVEKVTNFRSKNLQMNSNCLEPQVSSQAARLLYNHLLFVIYGNLYK